MSGSTLLHFAMHLTDVVAILNGTAGLTIGVRPDEYPATSLISP